MVKAASPKIEGALCDECPLQTEGFCPPRPAPGWQAGPQGSTGVGIPAPPRQGPPRAVLVGEAPGYYEVEKGEPFVGPSGQLLTAVLESVGVKRDEVHLTNAVLCRPPDNRDPSAKELACCAPRLEQELEKYGGEAPIVGLGRTAERSLGLSGTPGLWEHGRISTIHPAYVLRKPEYVRELHKHLYKAFNIPQQEPLEPEIRVVESVVGAVAVLTTIIRHQDQMARVIWDLETDQNKWYRDPILCMQIAYGPDQAWVIPDTVLFDPELAPALQRFFDDLKRPHGGHNIKFDMNFLAGQLGIVFTMENAPRIDTMLMHYVLKETTGGHGLKELSAYYFDAPDYEAEIIGVYLRSASDNYSKIPRPKLYEYGGKDVCYNWLLAGVLSMEVSEQGLTGLYKFLVPEANWSVFKMEQRGIRVDKPWLKKVEKRLSMECGAHTEAMALIAEQAAAEWDGEYPRYFTEENEKGWDEEKFDKILGRIEEDFNPNSFEQLQVLMFDLLGAPAGLVKGKKYPNPRTTAADALRKLEELHSERFDPLLHELIFYRKKNKLLTAYVNNLLPILDKDDRVHTGFLIHGTETGRLSARDPALQTIPRPGDPSDPFSGLGNLIRGAFIPAPGYKLIIADYAQAELRVAAARAGIKHLLHSFQADVDVHGEVTKGMFGEGYTKENRSETKRLVFCTLYGGTAYNFASDFAVPYARAQVMYKELLKLWPELPEYIKDQLEFLKKHGYVETILGRRRRMPLITDANLKDARKMALNAPIQGSAHELTMMSWVDLTKKGELTMLEVHDSVILECPEDVAEDTRERVLDVMIYYGDKYFPQIPWKADAEIRDRWGRDE